MKLLFKKLREKASWKMIEVPPAWVIKEHEKVPSYFVGNKHYKKGNMEYRVHMEKRGKDKYVLRWFVQKN